MMSPVKFRAVNWVDGMKISSNHFTNTDHYIQDLVRDASSVLLPVHSFGLLPPFVGEKSSHDIDITERATNHVEIRVKHCNAITADGCRIDIPLSNHTDQLTYTHFFDTETVGAKVSGVFNVLLTVNPFEKVPSGELDPEETPPRYPETTKSYGIAVLPSAQLAPHQMGAGFLIIGQIVLENGRVSVNSDYIPPCSSVISHPALIRYYEMFSSLINELQLQCFKIIDKLTGKESISVIGKNVMSLCRNMLDYIAQIFFSYRNMAYQQSPVVLLSYFSNLAHIFFTGIKCIDAKEREELLKYFYEWRDVTPGNFEETLSRSIEIVYDHHNILTSMTIIEDFLKVLVALWNKLGSLEYIGQRKENIVVAEQQMVQQVQTKRSWTLLD